jgi:S-adenosylmethionine:tRNA ribosyltransferase-isomerase
MMKKSDFYYDLPPELIAQYPLTDRTASRMLCISRSDARLQDLGFADIIGLCRKGDLLVFNNTRVMPARLFAQKASGGKVEILIERVESAHQVLAHVKASKSPKPGSMLLLDQGIRAQMIERESDLFRLRFSDEKTVMQIMQAVGHMPLPPYIARDDEGCDAQRYQTVFAHTDGAVAAPTAGLHFDRSILDSLSAQGVDFSYVTLHVGSGTFRPVRVEDLSQHQMHCEWYEVDQATVDAVARTRATASTVA